MKKAEGKCLQPQSVEKVTLLGGFFDIDMV